MTQKLKILGPYTPDHEGPFCTRDGHPVEIVTVKGRGIKKIFGYIGDDDTLTSWFEDGVYLLAGNTSFDLMNAEEVPQPREFWFNEYLRADGSAVLSFVHETETKATNERADYPTLNWGKTIHVREVLSGEGE